MNQPQHALIAYQRLAGLRAYRVVDQNEQQIEVHQRDEHGSWTLRQCQPADVLDTAGLTPLALTLALALALALPLALPLTLADVFAGTDLA